MAWFDEFNLPGATITGRFGLVMQDGPDDDDLPDMRRASGTVVLSPTTPAVLHDGAWIGIRPVVAQVFDGELVVNEEDPRPLRVLSTDAVEGVEDWAWTATFHIDGFPLDPFTFKAPAGETVVLTDVAPSVNSVPYRVYQGASIVDSEVDTANGLLRFELSNGEHTSWMDVPNGERGLRGPRGYSGADAAPASLTIGQVAQGAAPQAWITGTPPNQVLSLTLPRGARGHTPVMSWNGTRLVIDGASGPDLRGPAMQISEPGPGAIEAGGVEVHGFTADGTASPGAAAGVAKTVASLEWKSPEHVSNSYSRDGAQYAIRPDGEILLRGTLARVGGWGAGQSGAGEPYVYGVLDLPGVTFTRNVRARGLSSAGVAYALNAYEGGRRIHLEPIESISQTTDIYLDILRLWTDPTEVY